MKKIIFLVSLLITLYYSNAQCVSTLAGSGTVGFANGTGIAAQFNNPVGIAIDPFGNMYVADTFNSRIRKITPTGVVTTLAGSTSGYADGTGTSALFSNPYGVAVDASGNVYVADTFNNRIRKITSAGLVTTLAGTGVQGYTDGISTTAKFYWPQGVTVDASGNVYVTDTNNHRIRKISTTGLVTTIAGNGYGGFADGSGTTASFYNPIGITIDDSGNLYVSDQSNNRIRKISTTGLVTTLAGSGTLGFADGAGSVAKFNNPNGITVDISGNVYVADASNNRIRKITTAGVVTTLAGSGTSGFADGFGISANFYNPNGIIIDGLGNVLVVDQGNNRIRKISVTTASISYEYAYCISLSTPQNPILLGTGNFLGGTYSSTPGLAINSSTGAITPNNSAPGTYTVTYSTPSSGGCTAITATTQIAITGFPTASISYSGSPYCNTISTAQAVTLTGSGSYTGGSFNSTTGLTLNFSTGEITPSTSTPGTYTVTYFSGGIGCQSTTATQVTITASPTCSISYSGNPFCKSLISAQAVTLTGTGAYSGGTYSSTGGLTINTTTGAITPSTSTPGTYTVTYTTPATGGCQITTTAQITITALPTAIVSYLGNPFCKSLTSAQAVTLTGTGAYSGGTYSSTGGLTINTTTGAITPSISTPGTYNATYTTPSTNGCSAVSTTQITITAIPTASISYLGNPFCKSLTSAQAVSLTGTGAYLGGTFSALAGLTINSSTGSITPSTSIPGTYTITYTVPASGGCSAVSITTQVTITTTPTVSISYSGNPFCKSISTAKTVTLTGLGAYTGGSFSSTTGLSINSTTGAITPSTSTTGTYTVTYTTLASGGCSAISTSTQVTITAPPTATINYSGSPYCQSITTPQQLTLNGSGNYTGGYFSFPNNAVDSSNGAINPSLSPPGTYTVTYTIPASGGCSAVSTSTQVTILATPAASISADGLITTSTTINSGSAVQLQLNGVLNSQSNIQWTPASYISSTSISNPIVYPYATTTYTANFTNSNGCPQTSSITINVNQNPIIGSLLVSSSQQTIGLFDTITMNIYVEPNDLYSLYMKLKGNSAVSQYLVYTGYTAGTILGTGSSVISTPPVVTNGVPEFGITKVGAVPGYSGSNGLFYTFTYVPKNIPIPNGTEFCFYLDDVSAYNSLGTQCSLINQGQYCFWFTNQVAVWPGDLNKSNTVSTADLLPIGYFYNSQGPTRPNATIQWASQPATLWGYNHSTASGDGYKVFADSNGDGVINNADQAAIGFNMNRIHAKMGSSAPSPAPPNFTAQQLAAAVGTLTVTPNNTIINGAFLPQSITFTVNINNTGGLGSLYGISVNLLFDETIFDLNTATVDYTGSIFGIAGTDCLALNYNSTNMVSVGLTRYANAAINGEGLLFKVTIQTKSTLPNLPLTPVTAYVDAANNQAGDTLVIQDAPTTNLTIINNLGTDTIKADEFVLYPNPANDMIHLVMGTKTSELNNLKLKVITILGQTVEEFNIQNTTTDLSTKNWGAAGVYFVQITNSDNTVVMTKKVIVSRK